jgi:hypothetical protein
MCKPSFPSRPGSSPRMIIKRNAQIYTYVADVGSHSQPTSQAKQAQKLKQKTRQHSETSGSRISKAQ